MGRYSGKTCRLIFMLSLTFSYFLIELIVGHISKSLALIGDSYHMLSDVIALIVGLASVKISKLNSQKNTYGWARAEVLGALVNSVFLIALCFTVAIEAIQKLSTGEETVEPDKIDMLLYVGIVGFVINIVGLFIFHHHSHGHSHGGGGHSHGKEKHSHGKEKHSHGKGKHSHENGKHTHEHGDHEGHSHGNHSHDETKCEASEYNTNNSSNNTSQYPNSIGQNGVTLAVQDSEMSADPNVTRVVIGQAVVIDSSTSTNEKSKKQPQSSAQLNMRGVFLHVLGDALGSVAVIVSALIIKFATGDWRFYIDPALSLLMVILISFTSIKLLKESAFILLQTVPTHIQVSTLKEKLVQQVKGVLAVHEFHIWQLAGNRIIASAHIRCLTPLEYMRIAEEVKNFFHEEGIHSTTIQPEFVEFEEMVDRDCVLECGPDKTCFVDTCCARQKVLPRPASEPNELRLRSVTTIDTQETVGSGNSACRTSCPEQSVPSISYEVNKETNGSTNL